jgi:ADP-ribose pyrophosphatase YjhB (NUDIX family)
VLAAVAREMNGAEPDGEQAQQAVDWPSLDPQSQADAPPGALRGHQILEITVPDGSPSAGRLLGDIAWPRGCVPGSVVRNRSRRQPDADITLRPGDRVSVLVPASPEPPGTGTCQHHRPLPEPENGNTGACGQIGQRRAAGPRERNLAVVGIVNHEAERIVPAVPASAGAMIFDRKSRLLILKPTYKAGWTIPGGEMEADGETPWQACRREVREECGLDVRTGTLACVDFRKRRPGRPGGIRFLFDCGVLDDAALALVRLQPEEISEHKILPLRQALELLSGPVRRRVARASRAAGPIYLEDGRPVAGVHPAGAVRR